MQIRAQREPILLSRQAGRDKVAILVVPIGSLGRVRGRVLPRGLLLLGGEGWPGAHGSRQRRTDDGAVFGGWRADLFIWVGFSELGVQGQYKMKSGTGEPNFVG